jgi:HupH hydrogenase expression protein, C-terminal conserved region
MHANNNELAKIRTGLAQSVLREIAELLSVLVAEGETGAIDLHSLPMTPEDRSELEESLGRGDVEAILNVAGTSEVWETRYSGVWWVRHFGADDKIAAERIEITALPEILLTDNADIAAAAERLREDVGSGSSGPAEGNAQDA